MKTGKIITILVSVIISVFIGILMRSIGNYSIATIILSLIVIWILIGIIYFIYWFLFVRGKTITSKDYELNPDEAHILAEQKIKQEYGMIEGEQEILTVKAIGTDKEKDLYFLWIFKDRYIPGMRIGYFRNLKKIHIEGKILDKKNESLNNFMKTIEFQMNSSMIPLKEQATFREVTHDPLTGNILKIKEGTQLPMQVVQSEEKKGTVEVTEN